SACNRCTGDTLFDTDVVLLPSDLPVFEGTYVRILLHRGRDTTVVRVGRVFVDWVVRGDCGGHLSPQACGRR
ncbi:hypothetical protein, partial [Mycobacterium nebraskense]|uniref:hypothetical protein n=1 Tax=Mycobacterium nebraskense TaxID=244292 RepID=UPI001E3CE886